MHGRLPPPRPNPQLDGRDPPGWDAEAARNGPCLAGCPDREETPRPDIYAFFHGRVEKINLNLNIYGFSLGVKKVLDRVLPGGKM